MSVVKRDANKYYDEVLFSPNIWKIKWLENAPLE